MRSGCETGDSRVTFEQEQQKLKPEVHRPHAVRRHRPAARGALAAAKVLRDVSGTAYGLLLLVIGGIANLAAMSITQVEEMAVPHLARIKP